MTRKFIFLLLFLFVFHSSAGVSGPYQGELIDAYSTVDHMMKDYEIVIHLMQKAGVKKTILSTKGGGRGSNLRRMHAAFAQRFPDQIVPVIKIMSKHYRANDIDKMEKRLENWMYIIDWKGMGDLKVYDEMGSSYNAAHGALAVKLTEPRIAVFVELARQNKWPFILQIPFAQLPKAIRGQYFQDLEDLLSSNTDINIVLCHLGQLKPEEVRMLLGQHKNLYLDLSRTNPDYDGDMGNTMIFHLTVSEISDPGRQKAEEWRRNFNLKPEWSQLFNEYPDRFLVAYFNVGEIDWDERFYMEQTAWFRKALGELKSEAADRIAHGNAERLWRLQ